MTKTVMRYRMEAEIFQGRNPEFPEPDWAEPVPVEALNGEWVKWEDVKPLLYAHEPAVTNSTAILIDALRKNTPACGGRDGDKPCEDFADYKVEWSDRSARVCGMHLEQARGWARNDGSGDRTDHPSIDSLESGAVAREAIRSAVEPEKS